MKLTSLVAATTLLCVACGGNDEAPAAVAAVAATPLTCAAAAAKAAANPIAGTTLRITTAAAQPASQTMASHCLIEGAMDERVGALDGKAYAIKFRMRLPDLWNEKFYMPGGGGANGTLADGTGPGTVAGYVSALARGYAVIVHDSGHDAALADPARGGVASFGIDQQARVDFGNRSYDVVAQLGKALVTSIYARKPKHSYFMGCSEGGREAMMMTNRFPDHFDGVIAGCPAMSTPIHQAYASLLAQTFATLVPGQVDPIGNPLIVKAYSDDDMQLISTAILQACDAQDGLVDGMVNNLAACTDALVVPQLTAVTCTGAKTASCLSAAQVSAWKKVMAGPKTSAGVQIYAGNPWDPGLGGMNGAAFNQAFRSWWLGSYASSTNNAIKVTLSAPLHAMVHTTAPVPLTVDQNFAWELAFNRDDLMTFASRTTATYTTSSIQNGLTTSTDLAKFKLNGGKLIQYIGQADPAVSPNETIAWWTKLNTEQGGAAAAFARLFLVPGMNHGSGGPATDKFDMLSALEDWVERGVAPDSVLAAASNPGFFGVASRTRPLCAYPTWARYNGTGDINVASNFSCR